MAEREKPERDPASVRRPGRDPTEVDHQSQLVADGCAAHLAQHGTTGLLPFPFPEVSAAIAAQAGVKNTQAQHADCICPLLTAAATKHRCPPLTVLLLPTTAAHRCCSPTLATADCAAATNHRCPSLPTAATTDHLLPLNTADHCCYLLLPLAAAHCHHLSTVADSHSLAAIHCQVERYVLKHLREETDPNGHLYLMLHKPPGLSSMRTPGE